MISNGGTATLGLYDFKKQLDAFGGVDYFRSTLVGGYIPNARVMLANGEIVQNSTNGNLTNNPNTDMTGWVKTNSTSQIFNLDGLSQQVFNNAVTIVAPILESNTWQQNRDIIQSANDSITTISKGGKIQLPSGTFNVKGVILDSDITLEGNNTTLVHPDGFDIDMFKTRTFSTTASATKNTYTCTVASTSGIKVGSLVGLECGNGLNVYQSTTLVSAVDSSQTTGWQLTNKTGFQNYSLEHGLLICGDEAISYTSLDSSGNLGGVVRGALGTNAASHSAGAVIGISSRLVTEVLNISGTTLTLLDKVNFTVSSANLLAGTQKTKVKNVSINGARQNNTAGHRFSPFRLSLHRFGEANYYVENSENGAYLQTSSENKININCKDVSKTGTAKIGAAIWCYQNSHNNELNLKIVGDCWSGVVLDDRSNIATEWIGDCTGNFGTITGSYNNYDIVTPLNTTLLNIAACTGNNFVIKSKSIYAPVFVADDAQGISAVGAFRKAEGNIINVFADTCVNPVSATNVKNNSFKVISRNAVNPKPVIGNGNLVELSNYDSTNGIGFRALDGTYQSPAYSFMNQGSTGMSLDVSGHLALFKNGTPAVTYSTATDHIWRDGTKINIGSTTGTTVGLSSSQKLSFYGSTPIVRPTVNAAATDVTTTQNLVNSIRTALINLGIVQ